VLTSRHHRRTRPRASRAAQLALLALTTAVAVPATADAAVGTTSIGPAIDYNLAGRAQVYRYTAAADAKVNRLSIYLDASSTASAVELGLYDVARSSRAARCVITAPAADRWNRCTFPLASVVAGRRYYTGVLQPTDSTGTVRYRNIQTGPATFGSASAALAVLPTTWVQGPRWGRQAASLYADLVVTPPAATPVVTPPPVVTTAPVITTPPADTTPTTPVVITPPVDTTPTTPVVTTPPVDTTPTTPTVPTTPTTPPAATCTLHATPSTLTSVFGSAAGGSTICLASGSYDTFSGGSKSSMVTLRPESGASPSIDINFGSGVRNVRLQSIPSLGGWLINGSTNVEIIDSTFTFPISVLGTTTGLVFDGDTFNHLPSGTWEGRLSFAGNASGAVVRNSHFGNGGCSDGIQVTGNANHIRIEDNEFTGLTQGSCAAHVDPIQFYGADHVTVDGNFFHDNSTGIMTPDANGSPFTITNNVFVGNGGYPWAIVNGGGSDDLISHNTLVGGWTVEIGPSNSGETASNERVLDNVLSDGLTILAPQSTSGIIEDYNLGGDGLHSFSGSPLFVGGSHPTTYAGYRLAAGSSGIGRASNGSNVGIG
jgi:hypothetical protein